MSIEVFWYLKQFSSQLTKQSNDVHDIHSDSLLNINVINKHYTEMYTLHK